MNVGKKSLAVIRFSCVSACFFLFAGCTAATTVPAKPFQEFQQSIAQLKASSDQALSVEQELVYQRYVEEWKLAGTVDQLQLQPNQNPSPFNMQLAEAVLFKDIQAARSNLGKINTLVLQYANTLLLLTGSSDQSPNIDADSIAGELQTNANALAVTLGRENDIADGFFFGFGVLAKNYVEGKRQESLIELIRSSQAEIRSFAAAGRQITQISGSGIQAEYLTSYSKMTAAASELSESERGELIEAILALNEQTLRQLDTLKLIYEAYGALPAAHRKLEQSVKDGASLSFTELLTYAETLKNRYKEFTEE